MVNFYGRAKQKLQHPFGLMALGFAVGAFLFVVKVGVVS